MNKKAYALTQFRDHIALLRLDKLAGLWLLLLPCLNAFFLTHSRIDVKWLLCLIIGALCARTAGCLVNDLTDWKLDAQVRRTKRRPLASGRLSVQTAWIWCIFWSALGLGALSALPSVTYPIAILGALMTIAYPWMKRWISHPQVWLALTFNLGIFMAAALSDCQDWLLILLLYLHGAVLTLVYDTVYAIADKADDYRLGLHSTALSWGAHTTLILKILWLLLFICYDLIWQRSHFASGRVVLLLLHIVFFLFLTDSLSSNAKSQFFFRRIALYPAFLLCFSVAHKHFLG